MKSVATKEISMSEQDNNNKPAPGDGKVVPFPTHKVKKGKASDDKSTMVQTLDQNRKTTLFLSLLSTLLLATFLTSRINQRTLQTDGRGLASDISAQDRRDLNEDILLAKKIARESLREPASSGREPTAEDILRHGELAGLYALKFTDAGALTGIEYRGPAGQERYVYERAAFLQRHKDLLRVDFSQVKLTESIQDKERLYEVYELRERDALKARVHFEIDQYEHFYSMKVEF
jgi:hypothetical protein